MLGSLARSAGDAEETVRLLAEVQDLAGPDRADQQILAEASARLAGVYGTLARGQDAIDAARAALDIGPDDPEVARYAWASLAIGEGLLRGGTAGLDILRQRIDDDPAHVEPQDAELLVTRSMLAGCAGHTASAIVDVQTAIRSGTISATVHQLPRAHLQLAQLLQESGDIDLASTHIRTASSLIADERHRWLEAQVHGSAAMLAALRGTFDEADAEAAAAMEAATELGTFEAIFAAWFARGALARARGDAATLVEGMHLLIGTEVSEVLDFIPMLTSLGWWPPLIHAFIDTGDVDSAIEHIGYLEHAAEVRGVDLSARLTGLRARVAATQGRLDVAADLFAASLAARGPDDPIVDRGVTLQAYGRLLQEQGKRREALEQLRAAHDLFAGMGAEPYRLMVEADLARSGIATTPAAHRSPFELTKREQDVASLVATGMTNREVAAELYVSSKAVEYHLRNIFGKLGISSRRELRTHVPART